MDEFETDERGRLPDQKAGILQAHGLLREGNQCVFEADILIRQDSYEQGFSGLVTALRETCVFLQPLLSLKGSGVLCDIRHRTPGTYGIPIEQGSPPSLKEP